MIPQEKPPHGRFEELLSIITERFSGKKVPSSVKEDWLVLYQALRVTDRELATKGLNERIKLVNQTEEFLNHDREEAPGQFSVPVRPELTNLQSVLDRKTDNVNDDYSNKKAVTRASRNLLGVRAGMEEINSPKKLVFDAMLTGQLTIHALQEMQPKDFREQNYHFTNWWLTRGARLLLIFLTWSNLTGDTAKTSVRNNPSFHLDVVADGLPLLVSGLYKTYKKDRDFLPWCLQKIREIVLNSLQVKMQASHNPK